VFVFEDFDVRFVLFAVNVDFELHEVDSLGPMNVALGVQIDAARLRPTTGLAQVLDLPDSKSFADSGGKNSAHNSQVLVRNLVWRCDLIEPQNQLADQLLELVELRSSYEARFQGIQALGD
jgi:hypothetical protein